jgi:hypothetical protein
MKTILAFVTLLALAGCDDPLLYNQPVSDAGAGGDAECTMWGVSALGREYTCLSYDPQPCAPGPWPCSPK